MKTKEEIFLDEVKKATETDERFGKILLSDAIRKFTLNCLIKMEDQFRQPIVIKSVCDCGAEHSYEAQYDNSCNYCLKQIK